MGLGFLVVIWQPDHVATSGVERHLYLPLSAQSIDFKKDLAPGQVGETLRQHIQVASMRALYLAENAIGHGCLRSHDQILLSCQEVQCDVWRALLPFMALFPIRDKPCRNPPVGAVADRKDGVLPA